MANGDVVIAFPAPGTTAAVSGSVAVSNFPATQVVQGNVAVVNFPGTQPVSVASLPALTAGSAAIGTVGVTALPALPAGSAAIGSTITTPGALTNSAAVTTSATPNTAAIVVPYSASRKFVHVFSRTLGAEAVDLGSANVVPGSGIPITGGGGFSFLGSGAAGPIYAVTTVASSALSYVEG